MAETCKDPLCRVKLTKWHWCCRRHPGQLAANGSASPVTFEPVGIASASGIEETVALPCLTIEMPAQLAPLAEAVVGRHVASLLS